jgi:hypothetical protein
MKGEGKPERRQKNQRWVDSPAGGCSPVDEADGEVISGTSTSMN